MHYKYWGVFSVPTVLQKDDYFIMIFLPAASFLEEDDDCDYSSDDYDQCIALKNKCKTVDEKPCIFPFVHRGKEVRNCISGIRRRQPWCPTEVDSNGDPVPGQWGYCDDQCSTEGGTEVGRSLKFKSCKLNFT